MSAITKLMTPGGGGVQLTPASSIAADVTVNVPSQNCTLDIQGPAFSAYQNSSQGSIADNTAVKLIFDTEEFDTNNNFASNRFTPTVAGYYQINATASIASLGNNQSAIVFIYKNGSAYKIGDTAGSGLVVYPRPSVSSLVYLNGSTDYVEIYIQGAIGSSFSLQTGIANVWVNGSLARAA